MDRISRLPNEIIRHIVSFLSAKEAAFTSVLSKRFQNIFTIIPVLNFDGTNEIQGSLMDFLDGVSDLPITTRIRKFSLRRVKRVELAHYARVIRFLCHVLKRGIMDLELKINVKKRFSLPFDVFTCKTIVKLKLGSGLVIDVLPKNAYLPALEILFLDSVRFKDLRGCAFQKLLSACPVLKELTIDGVDWERWKWSGIVSSPTLQRLTIERTEYDEFDGSDFGSITFDTPSLVFLDYSDFVSDGYPIVNLESLVEAKLHLTLTVDCNLTNLINGLRNVEILDLLHMGTVEMFYLFSENIPVFENMHHLSISTDHMGICWRLLPVLLKNTPNLKTLVIKGLLHYEEVVDEEEDEPEYDWECSSEDYCPLSCPVRVLEITAYEGTIGEVERLKHFLENLSYLELVKICAQQSGSHKVNLRVATDLLMLPRASPNCKIQIKFA